MRSLFITDTHIEEKLIPESIDIFKEIFSYKADRIYHIGDFYNKNKPSPIELKFGTSIAKQMVDIYKDVTILDGNGIHSILHGESVTRYLKYLGIKTVGREHKETIDNKRILLGHFMLNESKLEYGSGKYGIKDLKGYDFVLLGHQHLKQELLKDKIYHIGSTFYQNFNEVNDPYKQIAIIDNGVLTFIPLKSPTPMVQLNTGDADCYLEEILPTINPKTKVKVVIHSFSVFKNSLDIIKEYKNKFVEFKVELKFEKNLVTASKEVKKDNLDEIVMAEVKKIRDKDVRELLESQFKEV